MEGQGRMHDQEIAAQNNEDSDDGQFHKDDRAVQIGRFLDADHKHGCNQQNHHDCHQVEESRSVPQAHIGHFHRKRCHRHPGILVKHQVGARSGRELWRDVDIHLRQQAVEIA